MDPLTHALSGLTASYCLPEKTNRHHLFCVVASCLPDIDNLSFLLGKEMYLLNHRGFCHSLLGGLILSVFLTVIFRYFDKRVSWQRGLFLSYSLICLHLFLDLITSFGTQLFSPFTNYRCAIPCVFIIDFFLTSILLSGVILSFYMPKMRKAISMACLCMILIYPIFGKMVQLIQFERAKTVLKQDSQSIHVLPAFFTPLYWKVIVDKSTHYELRHLSILSAIDNYPSYKYKKANIKTEKKSKDPLLKTYAWFVDFPAVLDGDTKCQEIIDLKFMSANPWFHQFHDRRHMPFKLTICPDSQCKLD
jgi:inner membrane protein